MNKILIAYYSYSGNTQVVSNNIKEMTGGDIFEIQPQKPYPADYHSVANQAKSELKSGFTPPLESKPESIDQYDAILIGSPCWWSTVAPPLFTFLNSYDFSGKTVVLFMTHEGSRFGHSVEDTRKACPTSKVLKGLPIYGSLVKRSGDDVQKWLQEVGILNLKK